MAASYTDTARNPQAVSKDVAVTLTDAAGRSATLPAAAYAAGTLVPEHYSGTGGHPEVVLGDVRLPLADFTGVDTAHLRSLTLGFGGSEQRGDVQLADIAYQEPSAVGPVAARPEAPVAALLPLVGLSLAGALVLRRRRTVH